MGEVNLMVDIQDECAICLEALSPSDSDLKKIKTLNCNHTFHEECIQQWGEMSNNTAPCPLCRTVFTADDNKNETLVEEFTQITFKNERTFVLWLSGFDCIFSSINLILNNAVIVPQLMFPLINNSIGFYGALKLKPCYLYTYLISWILQFLGMVLNFQENYHTSNTYFVLLVTIIILFDVYVVVTIATLVRKIRIYKKRLQTRINHT